MSQGDHHNRGVGLSIVVPALNEEACLADSIRSICTCALKTGLSFHVIVVDDGSTDGTWSVLTSLVDEIPQLRAIRLSRAASWCLSFFGVMCLRFDATA